MKKALFTLFLLFSGCMYPTKLRFSDYQRQYFSQARKMCIMDIACYSDSCTVLVFDKQKRALLMIRVHRRSVLYGTALRHDNGDVIR